MKPTQAFRVSNVATERVQRDGAEVCVTRFIISTGIEARDGDVWDMSTWELDGYRANPVVLDTHSQGTTADVVGRCTEIGTEEHAEHGLVLAGTVEWDTHETNPAGQRVAAQYERGFLNAVSAGVRVRTWVHRASLDVDHPAKADTGYLARGLELLEFSPVPIPADPRALAQRALTDGELQAVRDEVLRLVRTDAGVRAAVLAVPLSEPSGADAGRSWFDDLPTSSSGEPVASLFTNTTNGVTQ